MKIAYLANVRFPSERAHAVQIAHMCEAFVTSGLSVDLYANKRNQVSKKEIDDFFGFKSNFTVNYISSSKLFSGLRLSFFISEFWFTISFLLCASKKKYHVIYTRHEVIAFILSLFFPISQVIWESHEASFNIFARNLLRRGISCVCISDGIHAFYKRKNISDRQLFIAYDGVDESFFDPLAEQDEVRAKLGLGNYKRIVMYIGGFDSWKGIDTFFESSRQLSNYQFVAIGGHQDDVKKYSNKYPDILFLGTLPYKDLSFNQRAADVLVIPNTATVPVSSQYTSPLKLFAHLSSGVPLVITDIPSLTSVVNEPLVTVCKPDDIQSMAEAIRIVFTNLSSKREQATRLRVYAHKYTWTERARSIVNFISNSN